MIHKFSFRLKVGKGKERRVGMYYFSTGEIAAMVISGDTSAFYNSRSWRKLSHEIIAEGNNECLWCKQAGKYSPAVLTHHLNELKKRPDLAYSRTFVDEKGETRQQLIPLCNDCHEKTHKRGKYAELQEKRGFWQEEKW